MGSCTGFRHQVIVSDTSNDIICCGYLPHMTAIDYYDCTQSGLNCLEWISYHMLCGDVSKSKSDADLCMWRKDVNIRDPHGISLATKLAREMGEIAGSNASLVSFSYLTGFITICLIFSFIRATGSLRQKVDLAIFIFEVITFSSNFIGNLYTSFNLGYRNKRDSDKLLANLEASPTRLPKFLTNGTVVSRFKGLTNNYLTSNKTYKDNCSILIGNLIILLSLVIAAIGFFLFIFDREEFGNVPLVGLAAFGSGFGFSFLHDVFNNAHRSLNSYIADAMVRVDENSSELLTEVQSITQVRYRYTAMTRDENNGLRETTTDDEYYMNKELGRRAHRLSDCCHVEGRSKVQQWCEDGIGFFSRYCCEEAENGINEEQNNTIRESNERIRTNRQKRFTEYLERDTSDESPFVDYIAYHDPNPPRPAARMV